MSAIKCIVINGNGNPITNEDGTAYIYDSIKEARAEIRANGYSYNRANDRYYFKADDGTEYRAYILREGTPNYDYAIEKAEQDAAPEYIEPEAIQTMKPVIYSTKPVPSETPAPFACESWETILLQVDARILTDDDGKQYQDGYSATVCTVSRFGNLSISLGLTCNGKTVESCKRAANKMLKARYNLHTADVVAEGQTLEAMHAKIGDPSVYERFQVWAAELFASLGMKEADREMVAAEEAERAAIDAAIDYDTETAAAFAQQAEEQAAAAEEAARNAWKAAEQAGTSEAAALAEIASEYAAHARRDADRATETAEQNAAETRAKFDSPYLVWDYQQSELEAYLGEPQDYDVEAIEAEATAYDPETDSRIWTASGEDLARICERHQIATYYPAAV